MGVAHSLARRFFWSQSIVWKEDLGVEGENGEEGRDVTVVLSGRDLIVDTKAVRQYLTASVPVEGKPNGNATRIMNRNGKARVTEIRNKGTGAWTGGHWTGSGLELLWFEHLDHGQVFDCEKTRRHVVKAIRSYSAKG